MADEAAYQHKLARTRAYLAPDMQLLEFGCGTGSTALEHAPFVRHIRALDFSARMIDIARARRKSAGIANVDFEVGTIEQFEAPAGSFDMVLGMNILHLLEDPHAVVVRVHRLLRPGGVFVSSTACLGDGAMRLLGAVAPLGRVLGLLPTLAVMSRGELLDSMRRAGFAIEHDWQPGRGKAVFIAARKAAG